MTGVLKICAKCGLRTNRLAMRPSIYCLECYEEEMVNTSTEDRDTPENQKGDGTWKTILHD